MFTIVTPTYNRALLLSRVYESLCAQTTHPFEWVVVDDGSTDDTGRVVNSFIAASPPFDVIYIRQENGGKHRAVNTGVKLARTEYVMILDSDDYLLPQAAKQVETWTQDIAGLPGFAGVAGTRCRADGRTLGQAPRKAFVDATNLERDKKHLRGDKAEVYKTEMLRRYPFPAFAGERFLREEAVWDAMARDGYRLRWYALPLYVCSYRSDGLTKNTNVDTYVQNFQGYTYCTRLYLQTHRGLKRAYRIGQFADIALRAGKGRTEGQKILDVSFPAWMVGRTVFGVKSEMDQMLGKRERRE